MRLREGNKEADILSAAVVVFAETGFEATRMADIALRAGIATGTLYLYFKNKEILLEQIVSSLWIRLDQIVKDSSTAETTLEKQTKRIIDAVLTIFENEPELGRIFVTIQNDSMRMAKSKNALMLGVTIIESAIERGEIHQSINPILFAHFFWGSIRSLVPLWASDSQAFPIAMVKEHLHTWIHGTLESAKRGIL